MIRTKSFRALAALTAAVLLGLVAGIPGAELRPPTAEAQIASGTFIGRLPGTQTVVGVVMIGGESLVVYATDGLQQADWFRASFLTTIGTTPDMIARSGNRLRMATAAGFTPRGLMDIGGVVYEFSATPATGLAGVYRAQARSGDTTLLAGWIITNEGEVRGALIQRLDGVPDVVTPLDAATLDPLGLKATLPGFGSIEVMKLGES